MKFANFVDICIASGKAHHFHANFGISVVGLCERNTNTHEFCKLYKAIFSVFYYILQPDIFTHFGMLFPAVLIAFVLFT